MATTSTSAPFGALLKGHRLESGLTQEGLAARAGLSTRAVSDLERDGGRTPRLETVTLLAAALALPPDQRGALLAAARPAAGQILQATHPALAADAPPLRSPGMSPNNLPLQLTSFVGRERDVAAVRHLLDVARLVTLTGPGGIGKTRLALEVAAGLASGYADGVWLVELAALVDPGLVPPAIAAVMGVREQTQEAVLATLAAALHQRQALLVLDNCEHLVGACAAAAEALLQACARLRVLTTSRAPLGVAGETVWRLAPLAVPSDRAATADKLQRGAAVRLFLDRAVAADPTFGLAEPDAPAVARLCRRLDGLPLAIELAAPLVRVLTLDELARQLDDRFRLLVGGSRTALARQQTLRATIDWSDDLLDGPARALFHRLAVFAGGWTLEAAEAVCSGDGVDRDAVLALLVRLVDQSLVVVEEGAAGERRYRLLETLREYADDRLTASGEDGSVRARHAAHYLALADVGDAAIHEPDLIAKRRWLDLMETEHGNMRAAWGWLVDHRTIEQGLRHLGVLEKFGYRRGHLAEGQAFLRALLASGERVEPTPALVMALWSAAGLAQYYGGDYAAAQSLAEQCLDAQRRLGDRLGVAATLSMLALTRREQGDHTGARALLEESLAIYRELGHRVGMCIDLDRLGQVAHALGDYAGARALYEQAWQLNREVGNPKFLSWSLHNLGCLALDEGGYATARSLLAESLTIRRDHADTFGMVHSLVAFASLAASEGRPERAQRLAGATAALAEALGAQLVPTYRVGFERRLAIACQALSAAAAAAAWAEGWSMPLDQAIDYAFSDGTAAWRDGTAFGPG